MCADGLLLIKGDPATTRAHGRGPTVPVKPSIRAFTEREAARIVGEHKRNAWISADRIQAADFQLGRKAHRVNVHLTDGTKHKLLWLPADQADNPLVAWLSSREIPISR